MKRVVPILLLLCSLFPFRDVEATVYLVAVGISDYPSTENDLRHPVDDARLVVKTYKAKTSDMVYVQLYDDKATCNNIILSMQKVFSRATADDIVVLFMSGHGDEGSYVAYDGFLAWSRLRAALSECRSKHKMIFVDACFAGTLRSSQGNARSTSPNNGSNVMLFLSSRSNEYSIESGSLKQGAFTAFLCSGLKGRADSNRDKTVTALELYNYVHKGVIRKTAGKQHPVMWGNFPKTMPVIRLK